MPQRFPGLIRLHGLALYFFFFPSSRASVSEAEGKLSKQVHKVPLALPESLIRAFQQGPHLC